MRANTHTHSQTRTRKHNSISNFFVCVYVWSVVIQESYYFSQAEMQKKHKIEEKHGKIWKTQHFCRFLFAPKSKLFRKLILNRLALHMQQHTRIRDVCKCTNVYALELESSQFHFNICSIIGLRHSKSMRHNY